MEGMLQVMRRSWPLLAARGREVSNRTELLASREQRTSFHKGDAVGRFDDLGDVLSGSEEHGLRA